jgi:sec-independent protein translocase protein TatA
MGSLSIWHWLIVAVIVLLLFGRGKITELMSDAASGIKAFKKGMSDDEEVKKAEEEAKKLADSTLTAATDAAKAATSSATSAPKSN